MPQPNAVTTPGFFSIPVVGSNVPSATADNTLTAPAHAVTLLGGQGPRQVLDGVTNSTTLVTSATAAFNSGDIGRPISGAGIIAGTIIAFVVSATNITLSQPANASASGVSLVLGGNIGTQVNEVFYIPNGTPPILGVLTLFLYDGTTYHLQDAVGVPTTANSSTVAPLVTPFTRSPYLDLWIPPQWTLVFSSTVASQLVTVTAMACNA